VKESTEQALYPGDYAAEEVRSADDDVDVGLEHELVVVSDGEGVVPCVDAEAGSEVGGWGGGRCWWCWCHVVDSREWEK
jgi:hypothetical protein